MAPVTRRGGAHQERRAEHVATILAATRSLLAGGTAFGELSVAVIAAEAGISRSAFYLHFPDKSALLVRLAAEVGARNRPLAGAWVDDPAAGCDALVAFYTEVIATYRNHAPVIAALTETAAYDPAVRRYWDGELDLFATATRGRLEADQAAGKTDAALDPTLAAELIVRGGDLVIRGQVTHGRLDDDVRLARELGLSHWHGFFRRPVSTRPGADARVQDHGVPE